MDAREAIFARLPEGVRRPAAVRPSYVPLVDDLRAQFEARLTALAGRVMTLEEARDRCPSPAWVDLDVQDAWGRPSDTADIWDAAAGVTSAICAVAQTGSVLLSAGHGKRRMASLAPPVHIALVDRLVPTIADAVALAPEATSVLVTGPSRTADIEGVLVNGVHGPGEVWVVLMEGLRVD